MKALFTLRASLVIAVWLLPLVTTAQMVGGPYASMVGQYCIGYTTVRVSIDNPRWPLSLWLGEVGYGTFLGSWPVGRIDVDLSHNTTYGAQNIRYGWPTYFATPNCTPPAPSCSVSLSPNAINQGSSATLSWNTSGSVSWMYIENVGYVGSSGVTSVAPGSSTNYTGTVSGPGGTASCSGNQTLTIHRSCAWNGGTISHGQSVTAYQSAFLPHGSTCVSQARICNEGNLSGSYQYASCTVETIPPPPTSVSISANPPVIYRNASTKLSWASNGATSCTVTGGGESWTGTASPAHGQMTGAIFGEVVYLITCQNDGGSTSASTTVKILPSYEET